MTAFGYGTYLLRVHAGHRPREMQRLNAVGDDRDTDLLAAVNHQLAAVGDGYHKDADTSEGWRVRERRRRGRTVWLRIHKGPEGGTGETFNPVTGESEDKVEAAALLSGLRAMFVIPTQSYYGLLFVERVGGRHLKETVKEHVLDPLHYEHDVIIRVESFAESSDWQAELAGKQVVRVSELLNMRSSEQDASTPADTTVTITTSGGLVRRATAGVTGLIERGVRGQRGSVVEHGDVRAGRMDGGDVVAERDQQGPAAGRDRRGRPGDQGEPGPGVLVGERGLAPDRHHDRVRPLHGPRELPDQPAVAVDVARGPVPGLARHLDQHLLSAGGDDEHIRPFQCPELGLEPDGVSFAEGPAGGLEDEPEVGHCLPRPVPERLAAEVVPGVLEQRELARPLDEPYHPLGTANGPEGEREERVLGCTSLAALPSHRSPKNRSWAWTAHSIVSAPAGGHTLNLVGPQHPSPRGEILARHWASLRHPDRRTRDPGSGADSAARRSSGQRA